MFRHLIFNYAFCQTLVNNNLLTKEAAVLVDCRRHLYLADHGSTDHGLMDHVDSLFQDY